MGNQREIQEYWNARSGDFFEISREELESTQAELWKEYFSEILPSAVGGTDVRVLDCGAGAGFFTVLLAESGYQVTAVDYSPGMVAQTEQALEKRGLNARVMQMDAQVLQFSGEMFDAVVTRNMLWNLESPEKAYLELYRVLKPGGILMVSDGNFYLHLHDRRYASLRQERKQSSRGMSGCHERHNDAKVDYSIMEKIAETLPLSRKQRPNWDLEWLIGLGFGEIHTEIQYSACSEEEMKGQQLPAAFRISAKKQLG